MPIETIVNVANKKVFFLIIAVSVHQLANLSHTHNPVALGKQARRTRL
ncbi:MAG: hypothetical protein KAS85_04380 [Rhodobacteraceae bacterium]|nr:hypothetical protein [Paracoccaceae bacterium]